MVFDSVISFDILYRSWSVVQHSAALEVDRLAHQLKSLCGILRRKAIDRRIFEMANTKKKNGGPQTTNGKAHKAKASRKRKPQSKKSLQEIANEITLEAWKATYAKRDRFRIKV